MQQRKKDAVRLNKLISDAGFCSRREADEYIAQERVTVNGHTAEVGDKAFKTDFIRIDGEPLRFVEKVVAEKKQPEFRSKRIGRNLGTEGKKSKPVPAEKEYERAPKGGKQSGKTGLVKKADSKERASTKPEKKVGAAKKWFSSRKK